MQEAVFIRWANSLFENATIQELRDLADLKFLSSFASLITGTSSGVSVFGSCGYKLEIRIIQQLTNNRCDDVDAIFHALVAATASDSSRPKEDEEKLLQLSVSEIVSGESPKAILGMCWQLIQIYWRKFAPPGARDKKLAEALKDWCLGACSSCDEMTVNDFTSSWRDGMAMNIMLKSFDPSLVDLDEVRQLRGDERLENALNLAKKHLKVPRLIHPKEFASEHLEMKSVVTYLLVWSIYILCME